MGLKTKVVVVREGDAKTNRDHGKQYVITELPALRAEKWAMRLALAMGRAGVEIPSEVANLGIVGAALITITMIGNMKFDDAEPLLDEMMACVKYVPNPKSPEVARAILASEDVEEISTLLLLRSEWLNLHTGFGLADVRSTLMAAASALQGSLSRSTPTSQGSSEPPSPPA